MDALAESSFEPTETDEVRQSFAQVFLKSKFNFFLPLKFICAIVAWIFMGIFGYAYCMREPPVEEEEPLEFDKSDNKKLDSFKAALEKNRKNIEQMNEKILLLQSKSIEKMAKNQH